MFKKIIVITFLAVLIIAGCSKTDEVVDKAEFLGSREVKVVMAELSEISSFIEYSGKIAADDAINVKPAIGGKVLKMLVDEGSVVKENDLLVKLDETQLIQAKTQYNNAERNYRRMKELKKSGAIDSATFDEVETGYKLAKTTLEFLTENTHIMAPIDGVVTTVFKKQGENFDAMMDPFLIRMVNLNKVKARIQISDADINMIKKGQNVILNVNNSDEDFKGKVSYVSPEADMMAGTFTVEMIVQNKNNQLRNNQFVRVKVLTATSEKTIVVSQQAVIDNDHVYIMEAGKAVKKMVSLGLENEFNIEITNGLNPGDAVVILGNSGLSEGDNLIVIE